MITTIYSKNKTQLNNVPGRSPSHARGQPADEERVLAHKDCRRTRPPMRKRMRPGSWLLLLFALTATLASWQAQADNFCTRDFFFDVQDGTCESMQYFTPPKWSLPTPGYWFIGNTGYVTPQPAFDTQDGVVQYFVASNPLYNICGTTPYLVQDFAYGGLLDYGGTFVAPDPVAGIAYAFPVQWHIADNDVEYGTVQYKWVIPDLNVVPPVCGDTVTIPAYRRRIAVCPAGYRTAYSAVEDNYYAQGIQTIPTSIFQLPDICFKALPINPKNLGECNAGSPMLGNPINVATGNKFQRDTDIRPSALGSPGFERYYNSAAFGSQTLGPQWRHSYDRSVAATNVSLPDGVAWVQRPDGKGYKFSKPATGMQWTSDPDVVDRLYQLVDTNNNLLGWQYVTKDDDTELFDASGRLQSITARSGATQTLTYSTGVSPNAPQAGLLLQVADSLGRELSFTYDSVARIHSVTDPLAQVYQYAYDLNGNLATVTFPDGTQRGYVYNEQQLTQNTSLPGALTGIVDENGTRFATFSYDSTGRATATVHAGGVDQYQFSYFTSPSVSTVVIDPLGTQRTFAYSSINRAFKNTSMSQPCATCGGATASATSYDANGNPLAITDFRGNRTTFAYDLTRNLETLRTEAQGTSVSRIIQTQWNSTWRLPAQITEPAPGGTKATTFTYDASANLTQRSVTAPKNDGTGANVTRTWNWTYATLGRVVTATDPDGNTTTWAYYADNDPNLGKRGNVRTITNALGHVIQMTSYDANGRLLSMTDPNGLVTTLSYSPRGWLISRQVGTELTTYAHDGVGQLTRVTLPDSSYLQYTYDAAHRLTQVNDNLGNKVVYTLDAMDNRTQEQTFDPANSLARLRSHTFDALNRLASDIGAQSQTTQYTYDNNNNLLISTDPLGHATGNIYDALNRITQVLDPNTGLTRYAYDAANNLTQVTDPRNNATVYTYDGLNNATRLVSPDTGTTTSAYDAVGNLLTKTDARGAVASYTYDALNRITQVVYSKSGSPNETHTFTYDVGTNALGRLSAITDTTGGTSYQHDSRGRVTQKQSTITAGAGSQTLTTAYAYNSAGQLTQLMYPSGVALDYGYDGAGRVQSLTATLSGGSGTCPQDVSSQIGISLGPALVQSQKLTLTNTGNTTIQGPVTLVVSISPGTVTLANGTGTTSSCNPPSGRTEIQVFGSGGTLAPNGSVPVVLQFNNPNQITTYTLTTQVLAGVAGGGGGSSTTVTLLSNAVYDPFGPPSQWQWGNGLNMFRDYDLDGRLGTWEFRNGVSYLRKDYSFDAASRITGISDPNVPTASRGYQYDTLDRLIVAQSGSPLATAQQFGYDAVGNRLNQITNAGTTTLSYPTASNRLQTLTGALSRIYSYDAAGNPTALGSQTEVYNNANRLVTIQSGGSTVASYQVNALGQRVSKTAGNATTLFAYDEQGHLLGEYDGGGNLVEETVWLGDLPVATVQSQNGQLSAFYVHADHLGAPRAISNPADNSLLWTWDNGDPFGANSANENPTGTGPFHYALRFPGQYYDAETGTHYNYFRDYDPAVGRYEQSDPIGLGGGPNTYSYVGGMPLTSADTFGLATQVRPCPPGWICIPPIVAPGPDLPPPIDDILNPPRPGLGQQLWKKIKEWCSPDDDPCLKQWERESADCLKWSFGGGRWVQACQGRANDRLRLCRGNGGTMPPDAPEPWRPDSDQRRPR